MVQLVQNPPSNEEDMGSISGPGNIPHAAELSLCALTTEPTLWDKQAATTEPVCPRAHALQLETTAMRSL